MTPYAPEVYQEMGLRDSEFQLICKYLGRSPSYSELGMFAVMWSEHCGYKYSRKVLGAFKKYKEATEGAGLENAGIVPIGDGLGITFKVESHNHPSAVEPYQGAATGVGGILRDIFTMGARPIASLNSLRFGPIHGEDPTDPVLSRNRYLLERVVAGIAGYGNCVGVPTVGGELSFHPSYSGNPLVNAMSIGIVETAKVTTAAAAGPGNPVIYMGSATGRDGIHGATFASVDLDEDSEAKRPNVQIGDPFAEKALIEATLEALETGAIVAIQDMGAAGITCSTVEMAAKGKVGMEIDLDLVPMREANMEAHELLLSESQERMLCVAEKGREDEVLAVCRKWGISGAIIGYVTKEPNLVIKRHGEVVADLDPTILADQCPFYVTQAIEDPKMEDIRAWNRKDIGDPNLRELLLEVLSSPEIGSRRWVYRQFDSQVQTQTSIGPGSGDAAVLAPRGTQKGISASLDCNARQVYLSPFTGGVNAVAKAARNVACTGAIPVACTDGLNFGNPEDPAVYFQFKEAVEGIAFACEALNTPVVSGNVSFYNRSESGEIIPTPVIGMVGVIDEADCALGSFPSDPLGLKIGLLRYADSTGLNGLDGSFVLAKLMNRDAGTPIRADLNREVAVHKALNHLAISKSIESAHDVSEGGLLVALAELAIGSNCGLSVDWPLSDGESYDPLEGLFGEVPGAVLVCFKDDCLVDVQKTCLSQQLDFLQLGTLIGTELVLKLDTQSLSWNISELNRAYEKGLSLE